MKKVARIKPFDKRIAKLIAIISGSVFAYGVHNGGLCVAQAAPALDQPEIRLCLSLDSSSTPDRVQLSLVVTNVADTPARFEAVNGFFWGDVIVRCGSEAYALRHRKLWLTLMSDLILESNVSLEPHGSARYRIDLNEDYITAGELGQDIPSKEPYPDRWADRLKTCKSYQIYCVDREGKIASNVICIMQSKSSSE